ncbi:MAG: hypothetical protein IPJ82_04460 [Lewinellaceae bacterium]|nr:hypothetical protein [Lewinellaceae bacterium]
MTLEKVCFEFVETSFVGICTGKDSTKTSVGESFKHQWLKVKPNTILTQPPKKKNKESVSWLWKNKNVDKGSTVPLKEDFYVRLVDIRLTENEK